MSYERLLLTKPQCYVYKIAPRAGGKAKYLAKSWNLDQPMLTAKFDVYGKGDSVFIRLMTNDSRFSKNGDLVLFAQAIIKSEEEKQIVVEAVGDSSRYFVLRITNDKGIHAFIGIGFGDRGDSFDVNVCLGDHFKQLRAEKMDQQPDNTPKLDLGLKAGQKITINLGGKTFGKPKSAKPSTNSALGFLPPPPGKTQQATQISIPPPASSKPDDGFGDFGDFGSAGSSNSSSTAAAPSKTWTSFDDF